VLQCVAMCCSVLQCVAVCCSVLTYVASVAVCCSVLQSVAVCRSVLQCVAPRKRTSKIFWRCSGRRPVGQGNSWAHENDLRI